MGRCGPVDARGTDRVANEANTGLGGTSCAEFLQSGTPTSEGDRSRVRTYIILPAGGIVIGCVLGFTVAVDPPVGESPVIGLGFFGALFGAAFGLLSGTVGSLVACVIRRLFPGRPILAGLSSGIAAAIVPFIPALTGRSNGYGSSGWITWVSTLCALVGCALVVGATGARSPGRTTSDP